MGLSRSRTDMSYFIEKLLPTIIVGISLFAYLFWGTDFADFVEAKKWEISALYSSVFDLTSIICAFLLSFLIFVKTTNNRVLNAYRDRSEYALLISHFKRSIASSFCVTIVTVPYLIIVPLSSEMWSLEYIFVALWFGLAAYSLAAAVRSAYEFLAVVDAAYSSRFKKEPS